MLDPFTAQPTVVLGSTLIGAWLLAWLTGEALVLAARVTRRPFLRQVHEQCGRAWQLTLVATAELSAVAGAGLPRRVELPVRHALVITTIGAVSWLVAKALFLVEDSVLNRVRLDVRDKRRARRVRTQLGVLRRLTAVTISVIAIATILMTFSAMRTYGASVLASAG
ncbi:MAG: hypothetical protein ACJ72O_05230, partial [Marmoricola sp.]